MKTVLTRTELEELVDRVVAEVTERTSGVRLRPGGNGLKEDFCTVHIPLQQGGLTLCADRALLLRMARGGLRRSGEVSPGDLEAFSKEYFNVLCGRIASSLYRDTKTRVRFGVPSFYHSRCAPRNCRAHFVRPYVNDHQEAAQLIHHVPQDGAGN